MNKKVLFIQPPYVAGAMICLKEQIEEFAKMGIESSVIISGKEQESIKQVFKNIQCPLRFLKMYPWVVQIKDNTLYMKLKFIVKHIINILLVKPKLKKIIEIENPDYIYCNSFDNYLPIIVASDMKIPCVMHFHEYGILDHESWFLSQKYARTILEKVNLRICISKAVREFYMRQFPGLNFDLAYDGISKNVINKENKTNNQIKVVGIIGRITASKGQLFVIENAKYFPQLEFQLWGSCENNDYLHEIQKAIERDNLQNVVFKGFSSDIRDIYENIDMIIAPSQCEAFGRIIIEAMLNHKLVCASNTGSFPELIKDGETGFLFELETTDYQTKIKEALVSDYKQITDVAYKFAFDGFLSRNNAKRIIELINKIKKEDFYEG